MDEDVVLKIEGQSKSVSELGEGDRVWINGVEMIVDKHYLFMKHKGTNEMIIEVFNPANEREYQIRYFDDQVETSIEVFELVGDFQYIKRQPKTVSW